MRTELNARPRTCRPGALTSGRLRLAAFALAVASAVLLGADALAYEACSNTTRSGRYEHEYRLEEFVILFNTSGEHALPDRTDANRNAIPDAIDDIAVQLVTMREVLSSLGFRHPFEQYRYERVGVDRIYVAMRELRGNGTAFDPSHRDLSAPGRKPCVLLMHLSNDLPTENLTPAHELFHLYQYGYSVFKNSWYLEGLARWSEKLLRPSSFPEAAFPQSTQERRKLFSQSYEAAAFWHDLIGSISSERGETVQSYPKSAVERRYVGGERVIDPEASPSGASVAVEILEAFDKLDRRISTERGRPVKSWSRAQRTDSTNDEALLHALAQLHREVELSQAGDPPIPRPSPLIENERHETNR